MNGEVSSPFLKWPGGKRWFVNQYLDVFPQKYNARVDGSEQQNIPTNSNREISV